MQKDATNLFRINIIVYFTLLIPVVYSQTTDLRFPTYNPVADTIINAGQLNSFFDKLHQLEADSSTQTIHIVHIGDSHIQADFLTGKLRRMLQNRFGNAGRGLMFPLRITKTNEARDYRTSTSDSWQWQSIRKRNRTFEPGVAGISLLSCSTDISEFSISVKNTDSVDNNSNVFKLICRNDADSLMAFIIDRNTQNRALIGFAGDTCYTANLSTGTTDFSVKTIGKVLIDGVIGLNNQKGICYHSIGINGAHYADYNAAPVFFNEMKFLNPDLILVSLGTNEGVSSRNSAQYMTNEAGKFISTLRRNGINAPIAILTPFANYRGRKPNPNLSIVSSGLVEASVKNDVACIHMFNISGGTQSASVWRSKGLLSNDRIHYKIAGYEMQAEFIYNTLLKSYLKYVNN